jgi:hypothetical protein
MKKKSEIHAKAVKLWDEYNNFGKELEADLIAYIKEFGNNGEINLESNGVIAYTMLKRWDDTEVDYILSIKVRSVRGEDVLVLTDSDGYDLYSTDYTTETLVDICLCFEDLLTE